MFIRLIIVLFYFSNVFDAKSQVSKIDTASLINEMCKRYKLDQSNYNDSATRNSIFINNFNWLINTTKEIGFPNYMLGRTKDEKICIGNFTYATITHISQTRPDLLIDSNLVMLIKNEIIRGNINTKFLIENLNYWYNGSVKLCKENKSKYEYALNTWNLPIIETKYYFNCEK